MAIKELTLASTFEQTVLEALQNILSSKIDSDGRKGWPSDKEAQLETMLDYATPKDLTGYFTRHHKDMLPKLTEFLKMQQNAQFKALYSSYKGFSF